MAFSGLHISTRTDPLNGTLIAQGTAAGTFANPVLASKLDVTDVTGAVLASDGSTPLSSTPNSATGTAPAARSSRCRRPRTEPQRTAQQRIADEREHAGARHRMAGARQHRVDRGLGDGRQPGLGACPSNRKRRDKALFQR
jgi:hypothetical protein